MVMCILIGIWSPSGTPQPVRRLQPTTSTGETGQFKSEPLLTQSTPNTPTAERREFRSVKFQSPHLPRKNQVKCENCRPARPPIRIYPLTAYQILV